MLFRPDGGGEGSRADGLQLGFKTGGNIKKFDRMGKDNSALLLYEIDGK